jgi:glycine cleavage system transcriptional repressor
VGTLFVNKQIIISILSKDRPGIVADVASAIYELNGDLADLSQSVLRGYFNMTVMARFSTDVTIETILDKIKSINREGPLELSALELPREAADTPRPAIENVYVVTAQGENRTGLVASVASFCRDHAINILDYTTSLADGVYSMILEIDVSAAVSVETIRNDFSDMAKRVGLSVVVQNKKMFETINEITLN